MKLHELIQHQSITKDKPKLTGTDRRKLKYGPADNRLGSGLSSVVSKDKNPHMVNRYSSYSDDSDGYIVYAEYIVNHKLWEKNIHFPRIYVTTKSKDPESKIHRRFTDFKLERLFTLYTLTRGEVWQIIKRYFSEKDITNDITNKPKGERMDKLDLLTLLGHLITDLVFDDIKITNDEAEFAEAIHILQGIKKEHNSLTWDMHLGNIMIRRTSVGPQLVITDPFT